MGLNASKCNHKVRKVTPLESKDVYVSPANEQNSFSFGPLDHRSPTCERYLPPLRETLYGRGSPVPRPFSFDVPLENGDTSSIIKRHPPRRLQKLEPIVLPTTLTARTIISTQDAATSRKGKELERKGPSAKHTSARRQHIHKMQMLEMNRKREEMNQLQSQAELKRSIHREAQINKHKTRDFKAKRVRENGMKSHEDEDLLAVEHDETFNVGHVDSWHWKIPEPGNTPEHHLQKNSKLEMWFKEQHGGKETFGDSSSSESLDSWIRENGKSHRRPALIRTKAEKIPTFDEFFDRDF
ncbi:hypothetical protein FKM82_017025 [Ascaphus truei]